MVQQRVKALVYRLIPGPQTSFLRPEPLTRELLNFTLELRFDEARNEAEATISLKEACDTVKLAKDIIEPFVNSWEVWIGLHRQPQDYRFEYVREVTVDCEEETGSLSTIEHVGDALSLRDEASAHIQVGKFPEPHEVAQFNAGPLVQAMYWQYLGVHLGRLSLGSVAYFCVDLLKESCREPPAATSPKQSKLRQLASDKYHLSRNPLSEMATLASQRGGREARKATGLHTEFSPGDRKWLLNAIKLLIRRIGELEASPNTTFPDLTTEDVAKET